MTIVVSTGHGPGRLEIADVQENGDGVKHVSLATGLKWLKIADVRGLGMV